mmetsp:Transcript_5188/g.13216  ORF Transcript_5188/g.13216 Transcript_5188/m.13216 type:complete len:610 (-) Transcript_5188:47-1876(-)
MAQQEPASMNLLSSYNHDAPKGLPVYDYGLLSVPEVLNPADSDSGGEETQSDNEMLTLGGGGLDAASGSDTDQDTDLDDDGLLIQKAVAKPKPGAAAGKRPPAAKAAPTNTQKRPRATRPGGYVTLKKLLDAGLLQPGTDNLWCEYKGVRSVGSLTPEGRISWEGMLFESPSAWSIHLKRLVTPGRKADDGWKTIRYQGKLLEHFKLQLDAPLTDIASEDGAGRKLVPDGATLLDEQSLGASRVPKKRPKPAPAATGKALDEGPSYSGRHGPASGAAAEYAAKRPRREVKQVVRLIDNITSGGAHEGHTMVPCQPYTGAPGRQGADAQPFSIEVAPRVQMVMDLHAHLDTAEIIGLLAGSYSPQSRHIRVEAAFPVNELATEDDSVNVEMDPEDQVRVCAHIQDQGMVCVGWYHSHPDFPAIPSVVDIENQAQYQALHRLPTGEEPYIAAIVAPYLKPKAVSEIAWFNVSHGSGEAVRMGYGTRPLLEQGFLPRELVVTRSEQEEAYGASFLLRLKQIVKKYAAKFRTRVEMYNNWQGNITCLDKLRLSLPNRLPEAWSAEARSAYVEQVIEFVRTAWYPRDEASDGGSTQSDGSAGARDNDTTSEATT